MKTVFGRFDRCLKKSRDKLASPLFLILFFQGVLFAEERFISWDDQITIDQDATIHVDEKITTKTEGIKFKRGMWRSFPTRYSGILGLQYVVDFEINRIERDGILEQYSLVDRINGKQIYIGDPNKYLAPGFHTFLISYKTNRQLGFFKGHDELYYNVIGNDVGFVIDRTTARIHLPVGVQRNLITFEAYTGYFGQKGSNYNARLEADGSVFFETTKQLLPHQAFTVVVMWPKGYVAEPPRLKTLYWYIRDNISLLVLLIGLMVLIVFYLWAYRKTRKGSKQGVVIPLFHPPSSVCPGAMRYLLRKKYDVVGLSSDIVNMAVKGLLTIEYRPSTFLGGTYLLTPKENPEALKEPAYYNTIYDIIHSKGSPVVLHQSDSALVQSITNLARRYYQKNMDKYIIYNRGYSGIGIIISILFFGVSLFFSHPYVMGPFMMWIVLYSFVCIGLHIYFFNRLPIYTPEGQKLHDEIEGFKLFLATTETDRLKVVGTPPTKTPELWEKYLPYAIAFGVEKQWSQQFAPVFARLEKEGLPYIPGWYVGPGIFSPFDVSSFASGLGQSFNTAIAAPSTPPGSSSGGGGRGSSGGGGGGGGAGGW